MFLEYLPYARPDVFSATHYSVIHVSGQQVFIESLPCDSSSDLKRPTLTYVLMKILICALEWHIELVLISGFLL